jgi:signal transduction histidine kinase
MFTEESALNQRVNSRVSAQSPNQNRNSFYLTFEDIAEITHDKDFDSKEIMMDGIIHDFNNIITAILCNVSVMKCYLDKKNKAQEVLMRIENASRQAKKLCSHLSYYGENRNDPEKKCDISKLIREMAEFILNGSNVTFNLSAPADLWAINLDECDFSVIINNLLLNAKHAMPESGKINISLENVIIDTPLGNSFSEGKYVKIAVSDNGIGIPKQHLSKIFNPYFTTKGNGRGLGLVTTYNIIRKNNGYIELESELGVGTTFNIYLPVFEGKMA